MSSSIEDLPAVVQPTLPPPPDAAAAALAPIPVAGRRRRKAVIAGVAVVAIAAVIGWRFTTATSSAASGHEDSAKAVVHPPDLAVRVEALLAQQQQDQQQNAATSIDRPCTSQPSDGRRIPLVLAPAADQENRDRERSLDLLASAVPLPEVNQQLGAAPRIAVVRTVELIEPRASIAHPTPGRYEGRLAIIDATSGALLCHTRVVAWSSSVSEQPGVSDRALSDDLDDRVHAAFADAAARLHVEIDF